MSTYFKVWNSTISGPEPSHYSPEPPVTVGQYATGKPVAQGREAGTFSWVIMSIAEWVDLWDRYNTNKNSSGTFTFPPQTSGENWTSWRSETAYAEEPVCEIDGPNAHNVSLRVIIP
jgi:hypothetical protein